MKKLKSTPASFGVHVIAKRRTALVDRSAKQPPHRVDQAAQLRGRQRSGGAKRVQASSVQELVDVNVSESGDATLIEQGRFDREAAALKLSAKSSRRDPQGVFAESGEAVLGQGFGVQVSPQAAEAARVVEEQHTSVVERPDDVSVRVGRVAEGESAGHAQVDGESASRSADQRQLLAMTEEAHEPIAGKQGLGGSIAGHDVVPLQTDVLHTRVGDRLFERSPNGLDFGQLGHDRMLRAAGFFASGATGGGVGWIWRRVGLLAETKPDTHSRRNGCARAIGIARPADHGSLLFRRLDRANGP